MSTIATLLGYTTAGVLPCIAVLAIVLRKQNFDVRYDERGHPIVKADGFLATFFGWLIARKSKPEDQLESAKHRPSFDLRSLF
jgi:hypothetical protein